MHQNQHPAEAQRKIQAKLLIIRLSSFGDIVQAMGAPALFKKEFPAAKISWLVRSDFAGLLHSHPSIDQVIAFERSAGLSGLLRLSWQLSRDGYTHLYDAHNNVRSMIVRLCVAVLSIATFRMPPQTLVRGKNRLRRWLLFKLRINLLPQPFRGVASFQEPMLKWLKSVSSQPPQFFIEPSALKKIESRFSTPPISLVPSAAWEMKRWPVDHWKNFVLQMPEEQFVLLGGPDDLFCEEIRAAAPDRVLNLAGQLSLQESAAVVKNSKAVVANDTGLLHVADQLGVPTLALIGPTAFGYPYHTNSQVAEISLWCKPCSKDGRGKCVNDLYKRCLIEVEPARVAQQVRDLIKGNANG